MGTLYNGKANGQGTIRGCRFIYIKVYGSMVSHSWIPVEEKKTLPKSLTN